jgi:hypothetical protein
MQTRLPCILLCLWIHQLVGLLGLCADSCARTIEVGFHIRLRLTKRASYRSVFDLINFYGALLRDVHSLSDSDRHVLSDSWWLQSIVRSQEDGVDVFQCPASGLWSEEVEDDYR